MSAALGHRNLPQLLLQARELLMQRFRPILNQHELTEQQWRLLRTLLDEGPLEPRQLTERCLISSPSITGVLQRMEEAGLVTRERMGHDQRRVKVALTARARGLARRILPRVEALYAEIEAEVGVEALQRLYAVLDALVDSLAEGDARACPGR